MADDMVQTQQAYCFKCRTKREMQNPVAVYNKAGAPATRGECPECETTMYRIGLTPAHEGIPKPEKIVRPKRKKPDPRRKTKPKSKAKTRAKSNAKRANVGKLVIVESPGKVDNISNYLGKGYSVMSSKGHVRDLLKSTLSVDVQNEFEPKYRIIKGKREIVNELKKAARNAEEIYLATDPDREGEAMAWHLAEAAQMPTTNLKRIAFNEITKQAVVEAFAHPREINMELVNSQQARRILDRIVGFSVSELLWDKVRGGLSAGRVQSIALRLVVEREREIQSFVPDEYWTIDALLDKQNQKGAANAFKAGLVKVDGKVLARNSKDIGKSGTLVIDKQEDILSHQDALKRSSFAIAEIKRGTRTYSPQPPFHTNTLQRTAHSRIGFKPRRTMQTAQKLYEAGFITYMRTDSVNVSKEAQREARKYVTEKFGNNFVPKLPRVYKTKSKSAQEAHEAIRPTSVLNSPDEIQGQLNHDQFRLYKLIWERFLASQMSSAIYDSIRVEIKAGLSDDNMPYLFRASGSKRKFAGYQAVESNTAQSNDTDNSDLYNKLSELADSEILDLKEILSDQHFTQPPKRYSDSSLVDKLEELGIGRPTTRIPIVELIQKPERDYINTEGSQLIPTETASLVCDLLSEYFEIEMDYAFTAKMEDQLDDVSVGKIDWRKMLSDFYQPFEQRLNYAQSKMPKQKAETVGRNCPECNEGELVFKYSRWGKKYIGCANYPDCQHTESATKRTPTGRDCPECADGKLDVLEGRRGKFIACSNYPECRHTEPFGTGHLCPQCGSENQGEIVERRTRKGRVFFGCSRYPDCDYTTWKLPKTLKLVESSQLGQDDKEPAVV